MKRILFVDDESRILEGLQRMLRPCRKQWEMTFVNSGSEALATLAASSYDVIVSDMRMPGMDGAQLLKSVSERYPGMIRIVLSGQFEMEAVMRAVPVAHQFLTKPCDATKLREVIERSCEGDSIVADGATRRVIAAIGELPTLPSTYTALMDALGDPATSLDRVGAIVERDVGVAAKVLQLVNSAFFGVSHEVATVRTAVGYLGFEVLKQLVITVELFRTFDTQCHVAGFCADDVQRHCRCVAAIAARLPVARKHAAAISVAALLHDIGKLVLAVRLSGQFERALQASLEQNRPLYVIEEEMTGTSHAEIGAYLLAVWGLPRAVVDAVSRHHRPVMASAGDSMDLSLAIHIADTLEHDVKAKSTTAFSWAENSECANAAEWMESLPEWRKIAGEIVQRETLRG